MTLAPHPDDEALGCSGTLLQLRKKGASSSIVFLTAGERLYGEASEEIAAKRREEAGRSSAMLGCRETLFLDFPDGGVGRHREDIYRKLCGIIEERRPGIILSPSPIDYHADHISTSHIALRLLNAFHSFSLAFYEVYTAIRFNFLVDITDVMEEKKRIILNYPTSLYGKPELYVKAAAGLNAHRSIFVQEDGYYEAFYVVERNGDLKEVSDHLSYRDFNI